jgi:Ca2+-transporting ATPase
MPGLTEREAAARLQAEGPNALAQEAPRGILATAREVLAEPMILLLLAGGGLYLALGDRAEAVALLISVVVVVGIELVQERKTERAVAALRDLSSPRALVVREGARRRIPSREVVRGDVVVLAEGDRVPADGVLLETAHLEVDESLLTGEAVPVRKRVVAPPPPDARPGGDDQPFVYMGTLVVRGHALAEVRRTGAATEMGRVGAVLAGMEVGRTPLQQEVRRIVRVVAIVGLGLCVALAVLYGATRGNWLQGILAGIALAMGVLPEEFPVVLTLFMALGAWRISQSSVLTRRLPAVEALGGATVLCSDKTGTLTENRMRVARLWAPGASPAGGGPVPAPLRDVLELAVLASQPHATDPMDRALRELADAELPGRHGGWALVREYPLSRELLAVCHLWRPPGGEPLVAAKGAPEAIAGLCHLAPEALAELRDRAAELTGEGLRVLGVARAAVPGEPPASPRGLAFELAGLVAFADPVRAGVPGAVAECARAGVRVVMITGDAPGTAEAVAGRIGLARGPGAVTGKDLDALGEDELRVRLRDVAVFARTVPEHKLRLVHAFRARGEVVAMTGDGVNDAPALKAAHIGIAMGGRGTDVAREAAALVLTDDDFTSIVAAVRVGRRIYDNLRRALAYVVAVHVPVAALSLLPVVLGWPLILFPIHIVFLELIVDPACSLAFEAEPEEPGIMERPPRPAGAALFDRRLLVTALLQGATLLVASLVTFRLGLSHTGSDASGRALAFATLVAGNVALILVNRSWRRTLLATLATRNWPAWAVVVGATVTLAVVLEVPFFVRLFRFGPVSADDLAVAVAAGVLSLSWFELVKAWRPEWLTRKDRTAPSGSR